MTPYDGGCAAPAGGLRGVLTANAGTIRNAVAGGFQVPAETKLTGLRVQSSATGVAAGLDYTVKGPTSQNVLDTVSGTDVAPQDKPYTVDPGATTGGFVTVALGCGSASGCAATGPATLNVSWVGMRVSDTTAPAFAVGGTRSPAAGPDALDLDIRANDVGVGLRGATAYFDGQPVPAETRFPSNCDELTPNDATVDLALNKDGCGSTDRANIKIDPASVPDGNYTLVVRVSDWAGNVTEQRSPVEINNNVDRGQPSQTLSIGTSGNIAPTVNPNTNTPAGGKTGVAGQSSQNCTTPRLSFSLSQKPMRVSKGVPVLQSAKRYRFNGRLTCVINKKRRSAPKGARVELLNKIGKKTYTKTGTTVRSAGKLTIILSYKSSRTLIFRFTNSDGKRSQVSIKVKVEKKKKKASKR